jgi:PAS domain S-box-containing protein
MVDRTLQQAEEDLRYRLDFERLITRVIADFVDVDPDELDACIRRALERVGLFAGVDRAYVFLMCDDGCRADNTHEWCAPDVLPQAHRLQGLEIDVALPWFAERIRRLEVFHVPQVAELPEAARAERAEFESEAIQSLLVVPMARAGALVGFLGFDSVRGEKAWSEDSVVLLRILGDIITTALERRRADRVRRELGDYFRALVQNLDDVIIATDGTTRVSFESPSAARLFGRAPGGLCGRQLGALMRELVHPEDLPRVAAGFDEVIRSVNPRVPTEFRVRRADGSYLHVESVSTNLLEHPAVRGLVLILRDITERKRAEAEHRALEEKIRQTQKLESLSILAGGIAHDFNNLLTGILGNASLARSVLPPTAPAREHVELVEQAALRAAELTEQMLAYSGRRRFIVETVRLNSVIEEMSQLLSLSISKKCALRYELDPDLVIEGDVVQLRHVVMNLVINAAEAIGTEHGVITVRTRSIVCSTPARSDAPLDGPSGVCAFLEVSDTGCGMSDGVRARIFEPFFTTKFTGRGLGLAAVLGIVRGHHGAIQVESEVGRGTTVRVLFPAASGGQAEVRRREVEEPRRGGTVLVIDDEEIVRVVAQRMLERAGFEVLLASDGRSGLALFAAHAHEICLVLLDLTMPQLDGAETFRELQRVRADVPVILSSGYTEQDATTRFAGTGLAGFVQKPYSMAALTVAVRAALGRAKGG